MYQCSNAFHTAVAEGNPQKALLIFPDLVFTNDDISVDVGIEFHDNFNLEEDLSIGQASSNEISFSLFNDDRLLNSYEFGEFLATLGVLISEENYSQRGLVQVTSGNNTYVTDSRSPYIRRNGTALGTQPNQQIRSMLAYDGKLYCFGEQEGYSIIYNLNDGSHAGGSVKSFMKNKAYKYWQGSGISYADRILKIWKAGVLQTYEFVPLGWFTADRPKVPDQIQIDMTCNDFMMKFDEDWEENKVSVAYPVTIRNLYIALCNNVMGNNKYKLPNPFINGDAVISKEPDEFKTATKRDVMKWIAEAACANARIDRDGKVELAWLKSTNVSLDENSYEGYEPYWYKTKKVTKLYNRTSQDGTDQIVGTGNEAYVILDNPLLKGVK